MRLTTFVMVAAIGGAGWNGCSKKKGPVELPRLSFEPEAGSKAHLAACQSLEQQGSSAKPTVATLETIVPLWPQLHQDCEDGSSLACWLYQEDYEALARHVRNEKEAALGVVESQCSEGNQVACAMVRHANAKASRGNVETDCESGPTAACVRALALHAKWKHEIVGMDPAQGRKKLRDACSDGWAMGCIGLLLLEDTPKGNDFDKSETFPIAQTACGTAELQVCTRLLEFLAPKNVRPDAPVPAARAAEILAAGENATARARQLFATACERGYARLCLTAELDAALDRLKSSMKPEPPKLQKPPTLPTSDLTLREDWVFSLSEDFEPTAITGLGDGTLLVAAEFSGRVSFPGVAEFSAVGGQDIVLFTLDTNGQVKSASAIGGEGEQHVQGLVRVGQEACLLLSSMHTTSIVGKSYTPKHEPGEVFPEEMGIAVRVAASGEPQRVLETFPSVRQMKALGLPSGQLLIAVHPADDGPSQVSAFSVQGAREWNRVFDATRVHGLFSVSSGVLAAVSKIDNGDELKLVRLRGNAEPELVTTIEDPPGRPGSPSLQQVVEADGKLLGYGQANEGGRRHRTPSLFSLAAPSGAKPDCLAEAIGGVEAAGLVHGTGIAVINAVHTLPGRSAQQLPYPGMYAVVGNQPPFEFIPILQTIPPQDEPGKSYKDKRKKRKIVRGKAFSGHFGRSQVIDDSVLLLGRCGESPGIGCVRKMSLVGKP